MSEPTKSYMTVREIKVRNIHDHKKIHALEVIEDADGNYWLADNTDDPDWTELTEMAENSEACMLENLESDWEIIQSLISPSPSAVDLYEDGGGNLLMTDGQTVLTGFETLDKPGGLVQDITDFETCWDNGVLGHTKYHYREMAYSIEHETIKKIASYEEGKLWLNIKAMGNAGKRYAGIED